MAVSDFHAAEYGTKKKKRKSPSIPPEVQAVIEASQAVVSTAKRVNKIRSGAAPAPTKKVRVKRRTSAAEGRKILEKYGSYEGAKLTAATPKSERPEGSGPLIPTKAEDIVVADVEDKAYVSGINDAIASFREVAQPAVEVAGTVLTGGRTAGLKTALKVGSKSIARRSGSRGFSEVSKAGAKAAAGKATKRSAKRALRKGKGKGSIRGLERRKLAAQARRKRAGASRKPQTAAERAKAARVAARSGARGVGRNVRKRPAKAALAAGVGGAIASDPEQAAEIAKGHAQALYHSPGETLKKTGQALFASVPAAVKDAIAIGQSGVRAGQQLHAQASGSPEPYGSYGEAVKPAKKAGKVFVKSMEQMGEVFGSGSAEEIENMIVSETGLAPAIGAALTVKPILPRPLKATRKVVEAERRKVVTRGRAAREKAAKDKNRYKPSKNVGLTRKEAKAAERSKKTRWQPRGVPGEEPPPILLKTQQRRQRRKVAEDKAISGERGAGQLRAAKGVGVAYLKADKRKANFVPFLVERGIRFEEGQRNIQKMRLEHLRDQTPEGSPNRALIDDLLDNLDAVLSDPKIENLAAAYKDWDALHRGTRRSTKTHSDARSLYQAIAQEASVPMPEERSSLSLRDILPKILPPSRDNKGRAATQGELETQRRQLAGEAKRQAREAGRTARRAKKVLRRTVAAAEQTDKELRAEVDRLARAVEESVGREGVARATKAQRKLAAQIRQRAKVANRADLVEYQNRLKRMKAESEKARTAPIQRSLRDLERERNTLQQRSDKLQGELKIREQKAHTGSTRVLNNKRQQLLNIEAQLAYVRSQIADQKRTLREKPEVPAPPAPRDVEIRDADEGWFSHDSGRFIPRRDSKGNDTLQTKHGQGEGRVAYIDGEPVASVTWQRTPEGIKIGSAYTKPEYRGKGIFEALTRELRESGEPVDAMVWDNPRLRDRVRGWGKADAEVVAPRPRDPNDFIDWVLPEDAPGRKGGEAAPVARKGETGRTRRAQGRQERTANRIFNRNEREVRKQINELLDAEAKRVDRLDRAERLTNEADRIRAARYSEIEGKRVLDEFIREAESARRVLQADMPAWVGHRPADASLVETDLSGPLRGNEPYRGGFIPSGEKFRSGSLLRAGNVDYNFSALAANSIVGRVTADTLRRFVEDFVVNQRIAIPVAGGTATLANGKEIRAAAEAGHLHPDLHAVFAKQEWNRVLDGATVIDPGDSRPLSAVVKEIADIDAEDKGGRIYAVVPRESLLELEAQIGKSAEWKAARTLQRFTSRALLGTSPAWAIAQVIAESTQAALAVNPYRLYRGLVAYHKLPIEKRRAFAAQMEASPGGGLMPEIQMTLTRDSVDQGLDALYVYDRTTAGGWLKRFMRESQVGRGVKSVATAEPLIAFDRWKGNYLRNITAAGEIDRQLNSFLYGITGTRRLIDEDLKRLKGKPLAEQLAYYADNPKRAAEITEYVRGMMGSWAALSRYERKWGALTMFYPFLRYSLRWTFKAFPSKHPIKAAILLALGTAHASEIRKLSGGDPSFITSYAGIPIYNEDYGTNQTAMIPGHRFTSVGNVMFEAFGSTNLRDLNIFDFVRILQPAFGIALAAAAGRDPRTGDELNEEDAQDIAERGIGILSTILEVPSVVRTVEGFLRETPRDSGELPWQGDNQIESPFRAGYSEFRGSPNEQAIRSGLLPVLPDEIEGQRRSVQLARLQEILYDVEAKDRDRTVAKEARFLWDQIKRDLTPETRKRLLKEFSESKDPKAGIFAPSELALPKSQRGSDSGSILDSGKSDTGSILDGGGSDSGSILDGGSGKTSSVKPRQRPTKAKGGKKLVKVPVISHPGLNPDQQRFASALTQETGMDPQVVGGWVVAEQGFAGSNPNVARHNYLNIDPTNQAGVGSDPSMDRTPEEAAKATAAFLRGEQWGPGAGIPQILARAVGKPPEEQVAVLRSAGWDVNNYQAGIPWEEVQVSTEKVPKGQVARPLPNPEPKKRKGPYEGSQAIIKELIGPEYAKRADWKDKEDRGDPGGTFHDIGTTNAFAADITIDEAGLDTEVLVDRIAKKIGLDPAEVNYGTTGLESGITYQGYEIQFLPYDHGSGPHVHIGARWTGAPSSVGAAPSGGGTAPSSGGGYVPPAPGTPATPGQGKQAKGRKSTTTESQGPTRLEQAIQAFAEAQQAAPDLTTPTLPRARSTRRTTPKKVVRLK